jgi:DNA-binding LacI/PurR family transcriptional regulator
MPARASRSRPAVPRPTAADVAARAGVSRTTVSYVLNDAPGQSFPQETREAVLRAAAELGYRPNLAARLLAAGGSLLLIVVPRLPQSSFTAAITERLTSVLAARGVLAAIVFETEDGAALLRAVEDLRPRAVVFFSPPAPDMAAAVQARGARVITPPHVEAGPRSIGALQVRHLAERGHRRLAVATLADTQAFIVRTRRHGVEEAAEVAGLPAPLAAPFVLDGSDAASTVAGWASRRVTAVCAHNDDVALAVLHGIRGAGLRCPGDMAVVGADGIPAGAVAEPPLTTVAIRVALAADWYAAGLLAALGYADAAPRPADDIVRLIVRAST